ncbi:RNA-binding protein 25-like isoform X1 [Salvia splendens]|uniref:RNA-binding protein 25-like isoform X1 n=2 Tax=Salvia splendens TaxID=180675 RepID=UPI001C26C2B1|nr:RNA-binding protein 25-like isoform X1 [Salvia splendens]
MADPTPVPETTAVAADHNPALHKSEPEPESRSAQSDPSPTSLPQFPNPSPSGPPPPSVLVAPPPAMQPSFRLAGTLGAATPQFQHVLPYQAPSVPPPGVLPAPAVGNGPLASVHPVMAPPYAMPSQPMRYGPPMSNGYPGMPQPLHQGAMPLGVPRYSSPYAPMLRPAFSLRPLVGVMPPLARPPVIGIRGPIIPPVVRPITPSVTSAEEPQTTVYVGKISSTVENDFMLSLLQLCGPVKNWKRPQDPTGTLKGFGFCEFESAEGVLRALRLLNKLRVDGQELMLNVNQTTRKYLERYVQKKIEGSKAKEFATDGSDKEEARESSSDTDKAVKLTEESLKPSSDEQQTKDNSETNKENPEAGSFSLVTDEDRDADRDACEKLTGMLEERLKNKPLPPPPPPPQTLIDGPGNSNSEQPSGSKDREPEGGVKNDTEDKNDDDKTAESKPSSEPDGAGTGSPDRSRRHDRNRDRDRDPRRERERELERYEREREHERAKREKERENRSREDERRYKVREKEWESREREREHWRKRERERERERAHERKWEVVDQERDGDDGYGKKRKYKISDEERKRRQREKEEDVDDRVREEEEIAEAKMQAEDQKKQLEVLKTETVLPVNGLEKAISPNDINAEDQGKADQTFELKPSPRTYEVTGEGIVQNGTSDSSNFAPDIQQNSNVPTKKLGFGLSGFGKRAAVPSVFNEDEDEDAHKEKKMRPLVPIDYSTEEREAIQSSMAEAPTANMAAAAEFVKCISTVNSKEIDGEKEKSRRSHERSGQRDRDRHEEENNSIREESRRDHSERERSNKTKTPEKQKLLDAKQLIDTIPKTKDELFSYEINWAIYDQNVLHERMRPWVSKKITDFLGEEEVTLVEYIVSGTQEHVDAGEMLERLQTILDDEAEMFVLKMWRMLIFEIKKVETGLGLKPRA